MSATDATTLATSISDNLPMIATVGMAVLGLSVGIASFVWIRRALGSR